MKKFSSNFKFGFLVMALCVLSACSSSQVDEEGAPAETAGDLSGVDLPAEASTDEVPTPELGEQPAPETTLSAIPENTVTEPVMDAPIADIAPVTETSPMAEAPVMDAAPVVDAAPAPMVGSSDGVKYRVKKGDTLMKIAFEQYGDLYRWKEIYEANRSNIQDPNHVPPGTRLTLNGAGMVSIERNGESYLIKRGQTLGVISNDVYGTTRKWKKLWENNRQLIKDPNKIYAGFYLYYIPEGKLTHDEPAQILDESASVAPQVGTAPREPASAPVAPETSKN